MNNDLLNILANSNKDIDNQVLMDYLAGKLSGEQKHEVEKLMADNHFMNDAMEGLGEVKNPKDIGLVVDQLNRDLRKKIDKKIRIKQKRRFKEYPWIYFAAFLLLLLIIVAWFVVYRLQHPHVPINP